MVNALDFFDEDEYWAAVFEEDMGYQGDPRCCPRHPGVATSSPDGLHDTPCGRCEAEMDAEGDRGLAAPEGFHGFMTFDGDIPF